MSFLTTFISSFPLLSYWLHHITLSSSHFHSHIISSWSHFTSSFSLSPLSYYSSIHSNHIPCLFSSSHLHHAHHLAYSSIIHPTSSSFHPPSIPSFSHFSLFHSSISPWCSSRFPQNSFSLISFIILSYSLFHPPFHTSSTPSPSSPLISSFHSHSHLYSLSINFHLFPSQSSSQSLLSHSLLSISIPTHLIPFHFIILIHLLFLYWLLTRSVVPSPFIIHRSLSFHPFLFSFLYLPFYTYHSSLFFANHICYSTMKPIPCLFG